MSIFFSGVLINRVIGLMSKMFADGPGDQGSIPGRVIPKTQKIVLDASSLNTQHYKVCGTIQERSCTLLYTSV